MENEEKELTNWAWLRISEADGRVLFDCVHALTNGLWCWEWTAGDFYGMCRTVENLCEMARWARAGHEHTTVIGHFAKLIGSDGINKGD